MMTAGWKTSEFWLSLCAMLLGAFVASGAVGEDHWSVKIAALALSALAALGYNGARAKTKATALLTAAALPPIAKEAATPDPT